MLLSLIFDVLWPRFIIYLSSFPWSFRGRQSLKIGHKILKGHNISQKDCNFIYYNFMDIYGYPQFQVNSYFANEGTLVD